MKELDLLCDYLSDSRVKSKQTCFDLCFDDVTKALSVYGIENSLNYINEKTGIELNKEHFRTLYRRSKKKSGITKIEKKQSRKSSLTYFQKEKSVTELSVFDNYPNIWHSTKVKISENGYTPKDFKRIGIEGVSDGQTIDRLVDQAISSEKKEQGSQFASQFFKKIR